MTLERLKAVHETRPFKPFVLFMANGRRVPVKHPEFLSRSPSGRSIVVNEGEDKFHFIDLLLVTDLIVGENGRSRSRRGR